MDLILWRHAHAENGYPDLARPLSARGREEAREAAQWLIARLPASCRILVSPALRAQQTAEMLARPYETVSTLAPDAAINEVLAVAGWRKTNAEEKSVTLIVGHQPTLGDVAAYLLDEMRWVPKTASLCWLKKNEATALAPATLVTIFTP